MFGFLLSFFHCYFVSFGNIGIKLVSIHERGECTSCVRPSEHVASSDHIRVDGDYASFTSPMSCFGASQSG